MPDDDDDRAPDATEGATLPSFELELETFKILHGKMVETAGQIDALVLKCSNLLRLACSVADRIAAARRPVAIPAPILRDANKPTPLSKGPFAILQYLSANPEQTIEREALAAALRFSDSTLRTYLPMLRIAGLLREGSGIVISTPEGVEFVRKNSPTEQTEPSTP